MSFRPNFTPRAQEVLKRSRDLAISLNQKVVGLPHLLFALVSQSQHGGFLRGVFTVCHYDIDSFKAFLESSLSQGSSSGKKVAFSKDYRVVLEIAYGYATQVGHSYIGTEHIFISLLRIGSPPIKKLFKEAEIDHRSLMVALKASLMESSEIFASVQAFGHAPSPTSTTTRNRSSSKASALEAFAINYNDLYRDGKLGTIVCDDVKIDEITEILCRKSKNNPILLGEPGTGKTALVEGLTQKIASLQVSDLLAGQTIFGLDLASMIAGTKYRGQFEERLKKVIEEIKELKNVILFIDEIHTLVGAGSAEGTMDAANILKPMLARGELRCIGATTTSEYKKNIEKDGALDRRFQAVCLPEPSPEQTHSILEGIVEDYENFHNVKYSAEALRLCVDLSVRYIHDRHLPDKAIDLMDQGGAKVKLQSTKRPPAAAKLEKKIEKLMLKEERLKTPAAKSRCYQQQEAFFAEYKEVMDKWSRDNSSELPEVTPTDIYNVVAAKIKVPASELSSSDNSKILSLEKKLLKKVVGQQAPIRSTVNALLRNKSGLKSPHKPVASFLFLGPSGVGKTYLAQTLAEEMFGSSADLITVNMTEYSEQYTGSKLIGSAPGYVGYENSGQLTERVRKQPYSVLLFDEVEKAHESVLQMLLQILDEGKITDNLGREIIFRNCIIILAGNIGASTVQGKNHLGFSASEAIPYEEVAQKVKDEAGKHFPAEFLNRLDEVTVFDNLSEESLEKVISLELARLCSLAKDQGIIVRPSPSFISLMVEKSLALKDGARPISRLLQTYLGNKIAAKLLSPGFKRGSQFNIVASGSRCYLKKA